MDPCHHRIAGIFLVLCYLKLSENPKEGKWYRVTSDEVESASMKKWLAYHNLI